MTDSPKTVRMEPGPWREGFATETGPDLLRPPEDARALEGEPFDVAREAPEADFLPYPDLVNPLNPDPRNWSIWGRGSIGSDGRHLSAVGDHDGPNGEVFFFECDAKRKAVRRVFSFQSLMGHRPGDWGFGKLHGRLDADAEGWVYFAGYWGQPPENGGLEHQIALQMAHSKRDILEMLRTGKTGANLNERYPGGAIARFHPRRQIAEVLGVPVKGFSWPMHATDTGRGLMYLLGTDNSFACFDLRTRTLRFHGSQDIQHGLRGLLVDRRDGQAFFSADVDDRIVLARYDAASNAVSLTSAVLPFAPKAPPADGAPVDEDEGRITAPKRQSLRAATETRARDGWFYAMTAALSGPRLFKFDPKTERVDDLGFNFASGGYTTSIALSPGGRYLYFVPCAHGTAWKLGAPVVQYDTETRTRKVIAFLEGVIERKHGWWLGGAFGADLSPDGSTLWIPFNGNRVRETRTKRKDQAFGRPALVVVRIPESERRE
ncbi:MAG: hypothetical protein AAB215_03230 [Planctomycetota bacterium]